jgi:hypothetical protein
MSAAFVFQIFMEATGMKAGSRAQMNTNLSMLRFFRRLVHTAHAGFQRENARK